MIAMVSASRQRCPMHDRPPGRNIEQSSIDCAAKIRRLAALKRAADSVYAPVGPPAGGSLTTPAPPATKHEDLAADRPRRSGLALRPCVGMLPKKPWCASIYEKILERLVTPRRGDMNPDSGVIRLTAIVPNYNHGALIGDALRALAEQVPAPDEIIVVDDASTDNSIEILQGLSARYPALRIVRSDKNQGAIAALNRGLAEARGNYVYFGAADDLTQPGLFAAMLDALERHPKAAFACCEAIVVDSTSGSKAYRPPVRPAYSPAFLTPADVARVLRRIDNWIITGTAVVRREIITQANGFDASLAAFADGYVFRRLALQYGCCYVPTVGLVWQVSNSGLSRSLAADSEASLRTLTTALERMRADPIFPTWYPAVFEHRWRFAVGRLALMANPINQDVLKRVSSRDALGRALITGAAALGGPIGRFIALGWLSLRERPTSFTGILRTALARRLHPAWRKAP